MIVLVDTREKDESIQRYLDKRMIIWKKQKLDYGDYSFEFDGKSYEKEIVIERKGSIDEIIGNFTKGRDRFRREFERSRGAKVYLMIEASEGDIEKKKYRSSMSPAQVKSFIRTWCYKFGLSFSFVKKARAGEFILKVFTDYLRDKEG